MTGDRRLVVQMHGEPGGGKSTLAREIGRRLPALVLDKDVIKAALLHAGVEAQAGMASHEVLFDLAAAVLRQGHDVILDNPVYWPLVEQGSLRVAREAGAAYVMIECVCPDRGELVHRLATRERLASQPGEPYRFDLAEGIIEPSCERLVLDTTRDIEANVQDALNYIRARANVKEDHAPTTDDARQSKAASP